MRFLYYIAKCISKRSSSTKHKHVLVKREISLRHINCTNSYHFLESHFSHSTTISFTPTSLLFSKASKRLEMGNVSGGGGGGGGGGGNRRRRSSKSMDNPEIKSARVKLNDGRYLAYRECGVSKEVAKFKIIIVHGFGSNKDMSFLASQEVIEELKIYIVLYDRAGYGESDPNPKRSPKSEALDIEQLADQLQLGSKFYVIGVSMGSYPTWSCLHYIPHRLQGVALMAAVVNYRWPSLPKRLIKDDFRKGLVKLALCILKRAPGLLYWWMTQKLFPSTNIMEKNPVFFNEKDVEVLKRTPGFELLSENKFERRSVFDNLRQDFMVGYGKWEFNPLKLDNPFPKDEGSVHLFVGFEDKVVPVELQRYVMGELPWIKYHEIPHGGHLIVYDSEVCESVLRSLLLNEEPVTRYILLPGTPKLLVKQKNLNTKYDETKWLLVLLLIIISTVVLVVIEELVVTA